MIVNFELLDGSVPIIQIHCNLVWFIALGFCYVIKWEDFFQVIGPVNAAPIRVLQNPDLMADMLGWWMFLTRENDNA